MSLEDFMYSGNLLEKERKISETESDAVTCGLSNFEKSLWLTNRNEPHQNQPDIKSSDAHVTNR
jgi:hypothetical protein